MRAIVLAGGLGTRLRSVVSDVPKPMAPVAGRPFLERLLDYWIAEGVSEIALAVGYLHEKVRTHFGDAYRGIPITWSVEATPLGTGGGLVQAWEMGKGDGPALVLNGDTFFEAKLADLTGALGGAEGVMAVFDAPPSRRYAGIAVDAGGRITGVGDGASRLMNGGVYVFAAPFFRAAPAARPCSLEADWLPQALAAGQALHAVHVGGRFIDIGVPEDYARAAQVLGV